MMFIVTCVHNRFSITKNFVSLLKKQTFKEYQLILVDDGNDHTSEFVASELPRSILLKGKNLYWGGGLHLAYNYLTSHAKPDDIIVIINDDCYFENDYLENIKNEVTAYPNAFISSHATALPSGDREYQAKIRWPQMHFIPELETGQIQCLSTRGLIFRWQVGMKVGNFKSGWLPHYLSDYEFTYRAWKMGIALVLSDKVKIMFSEETTTNKKLSNYSLYFYFSKKCATNPFYFTNFALLHAPIYFLPVTIFYIWFRAFIKIILRRY